MAMTEGFSPRAKISFAPELPAGVVALNEPVDMFFEKVPDNLVSIMNASLPEGFTISRASFPPDDSPNLGKLCKAAEYLIRRTDGKSLAQDALNFWKDSVIDSGNFEDWFRIIIAVPAQNPIGGLVRHLVNQKIIAGWHEVNVVRTAIGLYDEDEGKVKI